VWFLSNLSLWWHPFNNTITRQVLTFELAWFRFSQHFFLPFIIFTCHPPSSFFARSPILSLLSHMYFYLFAHTTTVCEYQNGRLCAWLVAVMFQSHRCAPAPVCIVLFWYAFMLWTSGARVACLLCLQISNWGDAAVHGLLSLGSLGIYQLTVGSDTKCWGCSETFELWYYGLHYCILCIVVWWMQMFENCNYIWWRRMSGNCRTKRERGRFDVAWWCAALGFNLSLTWVDPKRPNLELKAGWTLHHLTQTCWGWTPGPINWGWTQM